jgi:ketosteroid isomerase-like protein
MPVQAVFGSVMGYLVRNKLALGIALGLASLTILPSTRADKFATTLTQTQYAELLRAREAVWRAWFANDRAALERLLPEDAIAINNGDERWERRTEVLESSKQFAANGGKLIHLSFPHVEVQSFGDVAVLYSLWSTETEAHGQRIASSGRATEIFVRRNGQWLNAGWHLDSGK